MTSSITWIVSFILITVLVYVFMGIFSFVPYSFWLLVWFLNLPLNLISAYIYPVWALPYIFVGGWILTAFVMFIIKVFFSWKD